jgi:phosphatidylglycerol---prolipoprotein diacylglyceryl transferase
MYPFIHIGPLRLGTYGIFVALGLFTAFYVVRADVRRRLLEADPNVIVGLTGIAGLVGARLYHLLESPHEFFADPWPLLFSTMGFAWFGSVIAGLIALLLIARHYKIGSLRMLDIASPAAAIGYGIGRIGCLISGDGDYGTPTSLPWGMSFPNGIVPTTQRVHPTPIYEFLASLVIFWALWKLGARWIKQGSVADGKVFAVYLLLSGVARFLVEFIRINPRSFFGMTNAQTASLAGIVLGAILLLRHPKAQASAAGAATASRS